MREQARARAQERKQVLVQPPVHTGLAGRLSRLLGALVACGSVLGSLPALAEPPLVVTSVSGTAQVEGEALKTHRLLAPNQTVRTGEDGAGSLLVDDEAVVQFCADTTLRMRETVGAEAQPRIVEVDRGRLKAFRTKGASQPLEIHTPVAIAVVHGTAISVEVDGATGDTSFLVEEGVVQIRNSDPQLPTAVTLTADEKVSIHRGELPGSIARATIADLSIRSECLTNVLFHASAVQSARDTRFEAVLQEMVLADVPLEAELADVAAQAESFRNFENPNDLCAGGFECSSTNFLPEDFGVTPEPIVPISLDPCSSVPGEQC